MGDSIKDFLEKRRVELDDIPSKKHPDGKTYRFTAPPWKQRLALKALTIYSIRARAGLADVEELTRIASDLAGESVNDPNAIEDASTEKIYTVVMGDTYDEMVADEVDSDAMEAVFELLIGKYGQNVNISERLAADGSPGESQTQPNRPTRRAAAKRAGSKQTPSGQASGSTPARTRSRTSTSGSSGTTGTSRARARKSA